MPISSIDSRLMSFGELLTGSNSYSVPHFQRDYSWTETEVDELWTDIINTLEENRDEHFIGAIVVNNSDRPKLSLIDGQQRLTTISLLMCVIRDIAKQQGDFELSQAISQNYLGFLQLRTRKTESKLILNGTNNRFYQENFVESKDLAFLQKLKKANQGQHKSNRLMLSAYLSLFEKVQELVAKSKDCVETLIQLEECVRDRLVSIVISVADEANSYLIFETLNNRGLELSVADLLKNHLFSKAGDQLSKVQERWLEISREIDKLDLTTFIRRYWLSNYGPVNEKELFRKIADKLKTSMDVVDFVTSLRNSAELYTALKNSQSYLWDGFSSEVRDDISRLNLFEVSQCYTTLLAAKESLEDELFPKILRIVMVFSFRYSVICGLNPNKLEAVYSDIAIFIRKNKPKSAKQIFDKLAKLYPDDETFVESFQKRTFYKNYSGLARYVLAELNKHYVGSRELIANPSTAEVNLEHILPQKPNDIWLEKFSRTDASQYIYRLGNMTLLDSTTNRKVGNNSFQEKRDKAFSKSKLEITKEIVDYPSWGPKQIEERQSKMARIAVQIWRLNY